MLSNALISVSVYDKSHPELGNLFQGDIILAERRNALLVKEYLWPNGVIPYVFHSNYSKFLKDQHKGKEWLPLAFAFCNSIIFDTIQYTKLLFILYGTTPCGDSNTLNDGSYRNHKFAFGLL
jgi:hypothetical protein